MRNRIAGGLAIVLLAVIMTGCGNAIPDMSEEQQELVAEYAAGVVLKYDKNHESKLVALTLEEDGEEALAEESEVPEAPENEQEPATDVPEQAEIIDNTENAETVVQNIESFLKLDSVKITYTGYEMDDFYPNESEGEGYYFIMNATEGNKLLVLKFLTENISASDVELSMAQSNVRFKVMIDGVEKNALTTMLLNDLAFYKGTLALGESTELVLVCEVSNEQAERISSLSLIMKSVDDTATISLN